MSQSIVVRNGQEEYEFFSATSGLPLGNYRRFSSTYDAETFVRSFPSSTLPQLRSILTLAPVSYVMNQLNDAATRLELSRHLASGTVVVRIHRYRVNIVEALCQALSIQRHSNWASHPNLQYTWDLELDWYYDTIVLHHSGNGGETDPHDIEEKHLKKNQWTDIGYHFLVSPPGTIYEGRALIFKGAHVESANTQKIGILIMGDFEHQWWDLDDKLSDQQRVSTVNLIKALVSKVPTVKKLGGHRDYKKATECPGNYLYPMMSEFRKNTGLAGP